MVHCCFSFLSDITTVSADRKSSYRLPRGEEKTFTLDGAPIQIVTILFTKRNNHILLAYIFFSFQPINPFCRLYAVLVKKTFSLMVQIFKFYFLFMGPTCLNVCTLSAATQEYLFYLWWTGLTQHLSTFRKFPLHRRRPNTFSCFAWSMECSSIK